MAAAEQIGDLSDREILIAGAIAYSCEGTKSKPYRRTSRVIFINSDPGLILFYLRFLRVVGVPIDRCTFRLSIHESADVKAAQEYWLKLTGADRTQFRRPSIKTHNPLTVRKNVGGDYRGCLRVEVLGGADLYQQIEGWCQAIMGQVGILA